MCIYTKFSIYPVKPDRILIGPIGPLNLIRYPDLQYRYGLHPAISTQAYRNFDTTECTLFLLEYQQTGTGTLSCSIDRSDPEVDDGLASHAPPHMGEGPSVAHFRSARQVGSVGT